MMKCSDLLAHTRCLAEVMQIKGPQETNRFARQDGGHELFLFPYRDCCAASQDVESPHRLHYLNVDIPPL